MIKKYIALKGTASDHDFLNKLKTSEKAALDAVKKNYDFNDGDNIILYSVELKALKKGKISVELK
jgi:hypothetical protein